ncbi:hypothetical protein Q5762_26340 [Streptomyces sp. P9(2023)]|uniref:hypothetical protein n=1 Tax=Streptomyces sp. P9(2023) TaxID=3064394 RepID=UPI0028F4511A|nr:hypothetical protein [Streptomyces sp. P9(2023)]MDT9691795.1 hypothetical protein [Streptomyces sp. P9(2023)]
MSRTARALAALAALVGVVFGVLGCGARTSAVVAESSPVVASSAVVVGSGVPGCGQSHAVDGAARPATPPRPNGFGDLLPTLAGERASGAGTWGCDQAIRALVPGPEPPELVPQSPVELSILRV